MSNQEIHNRRKDDGQSWFVKAGLLTRSLRFILTIFALLLAASLLFQFTANRSDAQKIEDLLLQGFEQRAALQDQADLIVDCTSPGGECFERGQQRTAEAVAGLNVVTEYSVICGEREDGEKAILECVNQEVTGYLESLNKNKNNG